MRFSLPFFLSSYKERLGCLTPPAQKEVFSVSFVLSDALLVDVHLFLLPLFFGSLFFFS